jgi:autotransporter-associated beta strand protein
VLQIDGVTLNLASMTLNKGGNIRMNGSASLNGVILGTQAGTTATLSTTSAGDVFTVGTGLTVSSLVTGGAADTVLNSAGPGTVLFSQANTYAGRWNFAAATNQISHPGALGTGANANIAAGTVFDLSPLGPVTFAPTTSGFGGSGAGATIGSTAATVFADPAGTLDLSSKSVNLTFTPTSSSGDATHPALYVAQGTLALSGNTFFLNNASGSPLGLGTYLLIQQAAGSVTSGGGYAALVSGSGLAVGTVGEIQVSGGNVNLVVSQYVPKNLIWAGGNPSTTWDLNTTPNFLNGASPSVFQNSDNVTFNSVGSANPTVSLSGTLAPGSATVDTSANDYTFAGPGQMGGSSSLVKLSSGVLLLQSANSYAGGTVISNGVVRFGTANAVSSTGNGDVAIYGGGNLDLNNFNGTINGLNGNGAVNNQGGGASVLTVGNNDRAGQFSGILENTSGTLALTKIGTNIQTLTVSNSYSGPTTVSAGTLATANDHALGIGDLVTTAGLLDVQSGALYLNSLAGTGGSIANSTTATTNRLIITGTNATTFGGSIADGSGGGGMALTVLAGSLTMSAPNTYSGGTLVASGASFFIANGPAAVGGDLVASNGATLGLSGGSTTPGTPNSVTTVDGASVTLSGGAEGKIWTGQFIGGPTTTNRFITTSTGVSAGGTMSFSNFLGLVQIATSNANFRFFNDGGLSGGDNTIFQLQSGNVHVRGSTLAPQTVFLGAFLGGSSTAGIGGPGTAGALPTSWIIGGRNLDTEFQGYMNSTNNLVKSGTGRLALDGLGVTTNTDNLTYTNYLYAPVITYLGTTTVSNGTLALICPNDLSNSPSITLASLNAVLDATQMGYVSNFTDANGANSVLVTNGSFNLYDGQTLAGLGSIHGPLFASTASIVSPGLPTGVLTSSGSATLPGAINVQLNRASNPNSGRIAAPSIDITGSTITVTNVGADLVTGDVFQLFSVVPTGTPAAVNLPAQNATATVPYVWTNMLAINGTIKVLSGAAPINPNPTNITFSVSGGQLTLGWPADRTGWDLQTNAVSLLAMNSWFTYPGSTTTNQVTLTIDPTRTNVYYRLHLAQ